MAAGSARLAEAHRLAQHRLGIQTVALWSRLFPLLDLTNLDGTTERWIRLAAPAVQQLHVRSAGLAADYLGTARSLDVSDTGFVPIRAVSSMEQIVASLRVSGPVTAKAFTADGVPLSRLRRSVFSSSSGTAMRLVLQGGRDTITGTVAADPRAVGWTRTTSGRPCAFCAMLASRGPVYSEQTVRFRAHGKCSCGAMAVYRRADGWTDQARRYREQWDETTAGRSGRDALNAFRRTLEPPQAA